MSSQPSVFQSGTTPIITTMRRRSRFTLRLSAGLCAIVLLLTIVPGLVQVLAFVPSRAADPIYAHTFLTYAFIPANILDWVRISLILVLASQVVERYLDTSTLVLLVLSSALVGSVLFLVFRPGEAYIGTGTIGAGYMGAYVGCWLPHRKLHGGWAKAAAIVIIVVFALELLSGEALRLSIILTGIIAAASVLLMLRVRKRESDDDSVLA